MPRELYYNYYGPYTRHPPKIPPQSIQAFWCKNTAFCADQIRLAFRYLDVETLLHGFRNIRFGLSDKSAVVCFIMGPVLSCFDFVAYDSFQGSPKKRHFCLPSSKQSRVWETYLEVHGT